MCLNVPRSERPVRVVIADDEPDSLQVVAEMIEGAGGEIVGRLPDGTAALATLDRDGAADLAILDQRMPGRTGTEVARELARRGHAMPTVILTAYDDVAPSAPGWVLVIQKGSSMRSILETVRAALGWMADLPRQRGQIQLAQEIEDFAAEVRGRIGALAG